MSDFEEHCFECDEPVEAITTISTSHGLSFTVLVHERTGEKLCYPTRPGSTYAEVCPRHEWRESETGCEDCGSHPAVHCPVCDRTIDLVGNEDPREDGK